jgi:chromosome segregation ATPase
VKQSTQCIFEDEDEVAKSERVVCLGPVCYRSGTMVSLRQIKQEEKDRAREQQLIGELNTIAEDIERCERTLSTLTSELEALNAKFQGPRNTRQDIEYLTGLLECAKRKLAWEKQLASIQKRTPEALERMAKLLGDSQNAPVQAGRMELLQGLKRVQASMERLQKMIPQ